MIVKKITHRDSYFWSILILAVLFICQFAGCSLKPEKRKTVISFSTWESSGEGMDVLRKLINQFEAKHSDIKIEVVQVPSIDYSGKILTQIAGGQAPDVINIAFHTGDLPVYVDKGALLCLEDLASADPDFNKDEFFPICIKACSHRGKIYALPKDGNPYILFYNKTLFDKAGISYPDENWTWDDFLDASRKLTRRDKRGRVITLGGGYDISYYYTLILQNGGRFFSDDGKECLLNSPEDMEAIRYALTFDKEGLVPGGENTTGLSGMLTTDLFPTGRLAMWVFHPYRIGDAIKRIKDFEWDIAPVPIPKGGRRVTELIHVGYAISSTTKHPQEAWSFIKWLGGTVGQEMMSHLKYGVPAIKTIAYSDSYGPPPEHIRVAAKAMEYSELFPAFSSSREIREKIIMPKLQELAYNLKPLEQVVKEIVKETNDLLNQNQ